MSSDRHDLIVPFLNDDPVYAYGVELGMLYARMRDADLDVIEDYFCAANQCQVTLTAGRLGWRVVELGPVRDGWFWCRLEREASAV